MNLIIIDLWESLLVETTHFFVDIFEWQIEYEEIRADYSVYYVL